jgi:hypothetical protein
MSKVGRVGGWIVYDKMPEVTVKHQFQINPNSSFVISMRWKQVGLDKQSAFNRGNEKARQENEAGGSQDNHFYQKPNHP